LIFGLLKCHTIWRLMHISSKISSIHDSNNKRAYSIFHLLRVSNKIFSLAKFLIPSFTCSMTYSVHSIRSTNNCNDFSSIFIQMKREVDGKSNMLLLPSCNTTDFWAYVHQTPNRMAFWKAKYQRFKTAKGRKDI